MISVYIGKDATGSVDPIDINKLERLAEAGQIETLEVINKTEKAYVYLNEEGIESESTSDKDLTDSPGPHYKWVINSTDDLNNFRSKYRSPESGSDIKQIEFRFEEERDWSGIINFMIPIAILIALWFFFMRRMGAGPAGGQIFNIGKSRASLYDKENNRVHFTLCV